jgi:hypothetical protein
VVELDVPSQLFGAMASDGPITDDAQLWTHLDATLDRVGTPAREDAARGSL